MSERSVLVCCGTGCLANHSMDVLKELENQLQGLAVTVRPEIKPTGCNGLCEKGPVVKIRPDQIAYFGVRSEDVAEIVEETVKHGRIIKRLLYQDRHTGEKVVDHEQSAFYRHQEKIALRNIGEVDPACLEDYRKRGGYAALEKALHTMTRDEIIETITASGLRGRGGAGFPTGRKWRTGAQAEDPQRFIICNGDEGDPGAFMDRSIMEGDPHSIIEGMAIAARAVGADRGFLYIRDEYRLARENMHKAIHDARSQGFLGADILGSGLAFDLEIVRGGGAFVCGESTALIHSIEGRVGEPRVKNTSSAIRGLWGKPTVLNNVETWANIPPIIMNGADWFRSHGVEGNSGTKVFSLVGKVNNTGLVEVPMGTTIRQLVEEIGGGVLNDKAFKAVQTGGPSGGCIPAEYLDLALDFESLGDVGSMMGSGGIIVMDEDTCMVEVARYYMAFLSLESCGKCSTCREGIKTMLKILTDITEGRGKPGDVDLLLSLCDTVEKGSLCALGKTAPNPVRTTIRHFRDEYEAHIAGGTCPAGVCKALTRYRIDPQVCIGCGICATHCPVDAISGARKTPHVIDPEHCIACGECQSRCPVGAISRGGETHATDH